MAQTLRKSLECQHSSRCSSEDATKTVFALPGILEVEPGSTVHGICFAAEGTRYRRLLQTSGPVEFTCGRQFVICKLASWSAVCAPDSSEDPA